MLKMGKISSHFIWHTTCNSHTANLLAKDVVDKTINDKVTTILKEYKHTDHERGLIDKGGRRIKLPCETRWCSYRDSYLSLIHNLEEMKIIAVEKLHKKTKQNVIQLLLNDEFIDGIKEHIVLLERICKIINVCKKATTSVADAVNPWLNLQFPLKYQKLKCGEVWCAMSSH